MNLSILQHYNGPNINQNTLLFLTYLSQKKLTARCLDQLGVTLNL